MTPRDAVDVPVLLIAYRRASTTRRVIDSLRPLRPKHLYFAANGPNPENVGDQSLCAEVRALAEEIDWHCDIRRLFRNKHLSARESISGAISWFFDHVEEGIILEDDCICDPSFFPFAAELLDRYRNDAAVMQIGATNFAPNLADEASYSFSKYAYIWGWATWRRAWKHFDLSMTSFTDESVRQTLAERFPRRSDRSYWFALYQYLRSGNLDTWDGQWNLAVFRERGVCVVPRVNLVRNIGFGSQSTNTTTASSPVGNMISAALSLPLQHPVSLAIDELADNWVSDRVFGAAKSHATMHLKMRIGARMQPYWKRRVKQLLGW
jgi:hypothetical protein